MDELSLEDAVGGSWSVFTMMVILCIETLVNLEMHNLTVAPVLQQMTTKLGGMTTHSRLLLTQTMITEDPA